MLPLWDCNAAVGPWPAADLGPTDLDDLAEDHRRTGITRAIVHHTLARLYDPEIGNRQLQSLLEPHPHLRPCWVLVPEMTMLGASHLVNALRSSNVAAVRCFPKEHNFRLAGPESRRLLEAISAAGVPLLLDWDQTEAEEVAKVCQACPSIPVLLCRVGYRPLRQVMGLFDLAPNCRVDLAFLGTHKGLEYLVKHYGAHRILFGTGRPLADTGGAITRLLYSSLSDHEVEAIAWKNLAAMLPNWEVTGE